MNSTEIMEILDWYYPNPKCELNYNKDYELLIATVLSAQTTDAAVNDVTKVLFQKYDLQSLSEANVNDIIEIIKPIGLEKSKSSYIINIAKRLIEDKAGVVPNDYDYLISLSGVGRKTANVVLSNLFDVPALAVDTHVSRVSTFLGITSSSDELLDKEIKLMNFFPKEKWTRVHHQLVLFGRYNCKSLNPECENCKFKSICKREKL